MLSYTFSRIWTHGNDINLTLKETMSDTKSWGRPRTYSTQNNRLHTQHNKISYWMTLIALRAGVFQRRCRRPGITSCPGLAPTTQSDVCVRLDSMQYQPEGAAPERRRCRRPGVTSRPGPARLTIGHHPPKINSDLMLPTTRAGIPQRRRCRRPGTVSCPGPVQG